MLVLLATQSGAEPRRPKPAAIVRAAQGPAAVVWEWSPSDVTIRTGQRLRLENPTTVPHDVATWDAPLDLHARLAPGDQATLRFDKPGLYRYRCALSGHSDVVYLGTERVCLGMCGVVNVE